MKTKHIYLTGGALLGALVVWRFVRSRLDALEYELAMAVRTKGEADRRAQNANAERAHAENEAANAKQAERAQRDRAEKALAELAKHKQLAGAPPPAAAVGSAG